MKEKKDNGLQKFADSPAREEDLTKIRENLMKIMIDPANRMKTVTDICKLAKISRTAYYKAVNDKAFMERYTEESKQLVKQALGPVVNSMVRQAQMGNTQAIKIVLEMAGIYSERFDVTHRNPPGESFHINGLENLSDEELEALAREAAAGGAGA
jgi:hypothetical protein